jgi:tRNA-guanine family transglycosylase
VGYVIDTPLNDLQPIHDKLPQGKPRYAPSCITPDGIARNIFYVDLFSHALPIILGSVGIALNLSFTSPKLCQLFTLSEKEHFSSQFTLGGDLGNGGGVDQGSRCTCWACSHHNRAYVHHLLDCHEMLGWTLLTMYVLIPLWRGLIFI